MIFKINISKFKHNFKKSSYIKKIILRLSILIVCSNTLCHRCVSPAGDCASCKGTSGANSSRILVDCHCPDGYYDDIGNNDEC